MPILQIRRIHMLLQYMPFLAVVYSYINPRDTKEIFLSDFVRFYQALDQNGIPVKLDIYEGMPHVHQYLYNTPESEVALSKLNDFLRANLDY